MTMIITVLVAVLLSLLAAEVEKWLPWVSAFTSSANAFTSSRHTRAGAASKPEGPGVSSSCFRNPNV